MFRENSDCIDLITKGKPDDSWYSIGHPKKRKKASVFEVSCSMKQIKTCKRRGAIKIKHFSFVNKQIYVYYNSMKSYVWPYGDWVVQVIVELALKITRANKACWVNHINALFSAIQICGAFRIR